MREEEREGGLGFHNTLTACFVPGTLAFSLTVTGSMAMLGCG
jgi:hypothetical protein